MKGGNYIYELRHALKIQEKLGSEYQGIEIKVFNTKKEFYTYVNSLDLEYYDWISKTFDKLELRFSKSVVGEYREYGEHSVIYIFNFNINRNESTSKIREEFIRTVLHELRHYWQYKDGIEEFEDEEFDAETFENLMYYNKEFIHSIGF